MINAWELRLTFINPAAQSYETWIVSEFDLIKEQNVISYKNQCASILGSFTVPSNEITPLKTAIEVDLLKIFDCYYSSLPAKETFLDTPIYINVLTKNSAYSTWKYFKTPRYYLEKLHQYTNHPVY
ncbi:hypothetical protein A2U94_06775 [Bacillus sp. VT 712]|uniref:Uncharacterized protein n=1 Tax=Priestia veravalensis TaxID=1414648 RepID=A0A0V8JKK7_9BACI|nr:MULTISPECIES: hypothetical protein [Bacillaceae]KSU87519.1 hypothetical protein AS180_12865 [Priestia veravalensis]KZB92285.1 hypothetical protein A2U94_06775 [Bacillus sp. VT 712]SCC35527.1 hypothetical protein GA0061087_103137 [Priestia flexa]